MSRRRPLLFALVLFSSTVALGLPLLENGFVNYDDPLYITDPPEIAAGLSVGSVVWAFQSVEGANWFPLTRLSWLLDAELVGVSARAFHATSLLLHAATAALLLLALVRLSGALWASAFVAGVFAVHPLHVESVAWAAARKDVVSGLFFALTLLAYARYVAGGAKRWDMLPVGIAFALGLMAKPMLVTLPCVLLLLDAWPLDRLRSGAAGGGWDANAVRRALVEKIPLFALALAACIITVAAQSVGGAVGGLESYPLAGRAANALDAYVHYLADSFWPNGLTVFYPYPRTDAPLWRVAAQAALLVGVCVWTLRELRQRPWLAVGWYAFLGMLVPVIGLVQIGQAARADRYTYLPLIGLAIMVGWSGRAVLARRPQLRALAGVAAGLALAALAMMSVVQMRTWRSSESLFEHALAVTDANHVAHVNLGLAHLDAGRLSDAEPHLDRGVELAPQSPHAWGLRGELRARQGRPDVATEQFTRALELDPDAQRWRADRAQALLDAGHPVAAEADWRAVIRLDPGAAYAMANLGLALFQQGKLEPAIASYRHALERRPRLGEEMGEAGVGLTHARLGQALVTRGDVDSAARHLDTAVELAPSDAGVRASRAGLLASRGRVADAKAEYREALRLDPRNPHVLNNLAWLLVSSAEPDPAEAAEAVALSRQASELTGGSIAAILDTLASAYAAAGHPAQAATTARRALQIARAQGNVPLAADLERRLEDYEEP